MRWLNGCAATRNVRRGGAVERRGTAVERRGAPWRRRGTAVERRGAPWRFPWPPSSLGFPEVFPRDRAYTHTHHTHHTHHIHPPCYSLKKKKKNQQIYLPQKTYSSAAAGSSQEISLLRICVPGSQLVQTTCAFRRGAAVVRRGAPWSRRGAPCWQKMPVFIV